MKATNLQKGCFKLFQRQMAEALNDSGQTLRNAIENNKIKLDTPWTEFSFEQIFTDNYLTKMYPHVNSISELSTVELSALYEAINNGVGQVFGVTKHFPSEQELMLRDKGVSFEKDNT